MALPTLTDEQRAAALEKAKQARRRKVEVKNALAEGKLTWSQLLKEADNDPMVARFPVKTMLRSLPGVGHVKAEDIMAQAQINSGRRLRGLGHVQREFLIERFG